MLERFLDRVEYNSYEDFYHNCWVKVPENFNYSFDVIDELAKKSPDKIAMRWCDVMGNEKNFTFQDMKEYSCKAANFFKEQGIKKGDTVMLILKRRYEFWFCILGLHRIGAIAIPSTHLLTDKDISYRANAAKIKMVVSCHDQIVIDHVKNALKDSPSIQKCAAIGYEEDGWVNLTKALDGASNAFERPTAPEEMTTNDDIMLLYFTSGTTGHPKMVCHNFTYPLGHIYTAYFWLQNDPNGIHLTVADSGWGKCVWGKLYGQWIAETCIFVYDFDKFIPKDLLALIEKYKITTFCAPPTIYRFFLQEDLSQYDLSNIVHFSTAGEALNPEVYNKILQYTGHKIYEGFGQTETVISMGTFKGIEPKVGSLGKPCPAYEVLLVDENDEPVAPGEEGQLCISLKNGTPLGLFSEYYQSPENTAKVKYNGLYHTGDIAWMDEDGYYWFVGRIDDVIKSSGYRIGPFEVESALMEHPSVVECAITGVPDPVRGQIVKATIVLAKGYEPTDELKKELQNHVKHTTAPYKYPRVIDFVSELPKTISGKVKRNEIRKNHN